jgi:hypothetical protein
MSLTSLFRKARLEPMFEATTSPLVRQIDEAHLGACRAQRRMLMLVAEADRTQAWEGSGARDTAHWISMRYGISVWKAHRWVAAAHALEALPKTAKALEEGELSLDKVVELCRFATPKTEAELVSWAMRVRPATVRERADLERRALIREEREAEQARHLEWWFFDENRRLGAYLEMPAAQGAVFVRAVQRRAEKIPVMPGEEGPSYAAARRADALVALCSARLAADPDPDRATVVVHAELEGLEKGTNGCEIEGATVVHPLVVRRLLCNARVQTVVEDRAGNVVGLGQITREPPAWMLRQLRYRDRGCRFPGCGTRAFTQAHHILWRRHGGRHELANLVLICSFHHKLVHELGWSVKRLPDGQFHWFHPDGARYRAGPSPGADQDELVLLTSSA